MENRGSYKYTYVYMYACVCVKYTGMKAFVLRKKKQMQQKNSLYILVACSRTLQGQPQ